MSKAEILQAIRSCAKQLKRKPTRDDLRRKTKINWDMIRKHFGGMKEAMQLAGLEATGSGFPQTEATLLKDWAMVARKLEKLPSVNDYRSTGRFSDGPFFSRYGRWTRVPETFRRFAVRAKLEADWADVLAMIRTRTKGESQGGPAGFPGLNSMETVSACPNAADQSSASLVSAGGASRTFFMTVLYMAR